MPPDILGEGKVCVPPIMIGGAAIMAVIENPANAARLVAVLEVEILIAPVFKLRIISHIMPLAGRFHTCMKVNGVLAVLVAVNGLGGGQVRPAAKPILGGDDIACIHMYGWNARIMHMSN